MRKSVALFVGDIYFCILRTYLAVTHFLDNPALSALSLREKSKTVILVQLFIQVCAPFMNYIVRGRA